MVEGGGLENRCSVMSGTVGSNPTPSAMSKAAQVKKRQGKVTGNPKRRMGWRKTGEIYILKDYLERWPSWLKATAC